jgi:hypothetical protein
MRGIARSLAVGWAARKVTVTASLTVAIGLTALATAAPAVAQDAPAPAAAATPPATTEATSDHGRHHGRKHHDDDAKAADGAAKTEPAANADAGAKTPTVSTTDSSAVAVVKPEQECRTFRPTGTRMPKTMCASAEVWKEVDARGLEGARQTKQTLNDSSAIAVPVAPAMPGGGGFGR